eukprot:87537-Pelagomonas_calceolata.AAC.2
MDRANVLNATERACAVSVSGTGPSAAAAAAAADGPLRTTRAHPASWAGPAVGRPHQRFQVPSGHVDSTLQHTCHGQ